MGYHHGLYTGVTFEAKSCEAVIQMSQLDQFISGLVQNYQDQSIVSVFMMPAEFYDSQLPQYPVYRSYTVNRPSTIAGHTPRNKKLLTYPFCFVCVDCGNASKNYRYELSNYSNHAAIMFRMCCAVTPNPEILCAPVAYNGIAWAALDPKYNYTEELVMTGFPQCAFVIDSYKAWLAQKATGEIIGMAGSVIGMGASLATGNIVGAAMSTVGLASSINQMTLESTQGSRARGNAGGSVEVANRSKAFYFKQMNVDAEHAEMIDSYFDRFGYAINKIKVPRLNQRPYWTYVKTKDCNVMGEVPADSLRKIRQIFDNGVTWWNGTTSGMVVGDYSQNNAPVITP